MKRHHERKERKVSKSLQHERKKIRANHRREELLMRVSHKKQQSDLVWVFSDTLVHRGTSLLTVTLLPSQVASVKRCALARTGEHFGRTMQAKVQYDVKLSGTPTRREARTCFKPSIQHRKLEEEVRPKHGNFVRNINLLYFLWPHRNINRPQN